MRHRAFVTVTEVAQRTPSRRFPLLTFLSAPNDEGPKNVAKASKGPSGRARKGEPRMQTPVQSEALTQL